MKNVLRHCMAIVQRFFLSKKGRSSSVYLFLMFTLPTLVSCTKDFERLVGVTTTSVDKSTYYAAGRVIDLGGNPYGITDHGFCWSQYSNPTINDEQVSLGYKTDTGVFYSTLSGILPGTTYYVRAYALDNDGKEIYGNEISFTASNSNSYIFDYIYDDGEADYGWRYNAAYSGWMGNYFPAGVSGIIRQVDIYFNYNSDHGTDLLNVDVFDDGHNYIGYLDYFTPPNDGWYSFTGLDIPFSGNFYVMVQWEATVSPTNYLGMDQNGTYSYLDYAYQSSDGATWTKLSVNPNGNQLAGNFLIRVKAEISYKNGQTKMVTYGPPKTAGIKSNNFFAGSVGKLFHK